jgi:hypothetical protein
MKRTVPLLVCFAVLIAVLVSPERSNANNDSGLESPSTNLQFASPEQTWTLYKNALLEGDYELAEKCCCPGKTKHVFVYKRMRESKRQQILQNIKSLEKVYLKKDEAKYKLIKNVNGVDVFSYVYFARIDNQWKIEHQ